MRHKDGSEVWIRDEAVLLEEDGEPQWHGILTDFTEQRTLDERLRQSQKIEAVGQLAGGIAHDFNNLLVAINGYGELALARAGDDAELRHALEQIDFASAKARDLTQRLLSFSRKEARISGTVDLNKVVASAHPMLRRLIGADVELVTLPAEQDVLRVRRSDRARPGSAQSRRQRARCDAGRRAADHLDRRRDPRRLALRVSPRRRHRLRNRPGARCRDSSSPSSRRRRQASAPGSGWRWCATSSGVAAAMIEVETDPAEGTAFTLLLPAVSAPAVLPAPTPSKPTQPRTAPRRSC